MHPERKEGKLEEGGGASKPCKTLSVEQMVRKDLC